MGPHLCRSNAGKVAYLVHVQAELLGGTLVAVNSDDPIGAPCPSAHLRSVPLRFLSDQERDQQYPQTVSITAGTPREALAH